MLFKGTEQQCKCLVDWLNSLLPGVVKFTYQYSMEKVEFLDLEILKQNGKLVTNLYIKPNNQQIYLDFESNHPQPCKESIAYGQALRIIERCSFESDRDSHLSKLSKNLVDRNYPKNVIEKQFLKAKSKSRTQLLNQRRVYRGGNKKVRLIFTHNNNGPPLHQWVRESKKLLVRNHIAKEIGDQIQISFRQTKNLKSLLTGQDKTPKAEIVQNPGCFKCH